MHSYTYTAKRKSDGAEICTDTITDLADKGMPAMEERIKSMLIRTHPMAQALTKDDIVLSMSFAK